MKHIWKIGFLLTLFFTNCNLANCYSDPACKRVLFIGNSYTYTNDLPGTLEKLAESGGFRLETGISAQGGWTLSDHLTSPDTNAQFENSKWNYIVLQEQSNIPASDSIRNSKMYPAARKLAEKTTQLSAQPILFVTWGHQSGWPENSMPTYESMQLALNYGYLTVARQLHATLAPVGFAWLALHRNHPQLNLWQEDGSHPNENGTYLAACIFYAVIFQKSPEGLNYHGQLSDENATLIQKTAADIVLTDKIRWNLP